MFQTVLNSLMTGRRSYTALVAPALAVLFTMGSAKADCTSMLAPIFNPPGNQGVIATVTKQYAAGYLAGYWTPISSTPDPVRYGTGPLPTYGNTWWPSGNFSYLAYTISGSFSMVANSSNPPFAPGALGLNLAINTTGHVSVQELINGKPIGAQAPIVYQAVCSGGLISVVDKSTAWTISLATFEFGPK